MILIEQFEELENKVINALQMIDGLKSDNARVENDNESLKGEVEEIRLNLDNREQEIERIKKELDESTGELGELREMEEALEKKIISLLSRLDLFQADIIRDGEDVQPDESDVVADLKPDTDAESVDETEVAEADDSDPTADEEEVLEDAEVAEADDSVSTADKEEALEDAEVAEADDSVSTADEEEALILLEDDDDEILITGESEGAGETSMEDETDNEGEFIIVEVDDEHLASNTG